MEKEDIVYRGTYFEGDIYQQIYEATGLDIRNDSNYRIGFVGAEDNMGISETQYSEFYVYRKLDNTKGKTGEGVVPPIPPQPDPIGKTGGGIIPPNPPQPDPIGKTGGGAVPPTPPQPDPIGKIGGEPIPPIPPEFEEAIKKYISEPTKEEPRFIRVVRKYTNSAAKWLCTLALLLVLLSGFRIVDKKEINVESITTTSVGYVVQMTNGDKITITNEQLQQILGDMAIGDFVNLQEGDEFYWDSLLNDPKGFAGNGLIDPGKHQISGISIVVGDKIIDAEVDLNVENPGLKIEDFVRQTCEKYGLDASKISVRIHIGNSKNNTRAGWMDATELLTIDHLDQDLIKKVAAESATYTDYVENFEGSTITCKTENGDVVIPVKDQNGNFYTPGTKVVGSDGNEYIIQDLSVTENTTEYQNEVTTGKKLTWRIQDCNLALGLLPLAAAIATDIATKKKNEKAQQNPKFFEFENEAEYQAFKREFERRKEEYEKTSGFKRMLKEMFWRKEVDLLQNLTPQQVEQLYSAIKNCHNEYYSYNENDKINFKNGKIIVTFKDGRRQDITDIVMPSIAHIGKDNPVDTEGLLPENLEEEGKKTL